MVKKPKRRSKGVGQAPLHKKPQPEPTAPSTVRTWAIGLGFPVSAYGLGASMMTPEHFWFGTILALVAALFFLADWLYLSRDRPRLQRAVGSLVSVAASVPILWMALQPAPIRILTTASMENYEPGTVNNGIEWQPIYSEINLTLANDSGMQYRNIDAYFRTDMMIIRSGAESGIVKCSIVPEAPGLKISSPFARGKDSGGHDFTMLFSGLRIDTYNRIFCDSMPPHSSVTVTFALLPGMRAGPGFQPFETKRRLPTWSAIGIDYEAGNRLRHSFQIKCELRSCPAIPRTPAEVGYVSNP